MSDHALGALAWYVGAPMIAIGADAHKHWLIWLGLVIFVGALAYGFGRQRN